MAEQASQTTTIAASPERVWAIAADVERYPDWVTDVKDVVVRARDPEGRPLEVEFRASALGRSTHYTLSYDYGSAPEVMAWSLLRGDIMRTLDGAYHFSATPDGGTEVRYDLTIDLVVPLPGFVKRRAEVRILNTVRELKARAEA
ncbi:MAG: SRPBCC family protein [Actinobacteria bacterium]|nr:SRPBCC family protein [Actinomycetota bacterium]